MSTAAWFQTFLPELWVDERTLLAAAVVDNVATRDSTAASGALLTTARQHFDRHFSADEFLARAWVDAERRDDCSWAAAARESWHSSAALDLRARWSGLWFCSCSLHRATTAALSATIVHHEGGDLARVLAAHHMYWQPEAQP